MKETAAKVFESLGEETKREILTNAVERILKEVKIEWNLEEIIRKEAIKFAEEYIKTPEFQEKIKAAVYRYVECHTMERIAEKMNYSTRNMYCFRQKILEWWAIFLGEEIGGGKVKTNVKFLSR